MILASLIISVSLTSLFLILADYILINYLKLKNKYHLKLILILISLIFCLYVIR